MANRRLRVSIQVLAPSNRPVLITENLGDLRHETCPKQLQRRQPKRERLTADGRISAVTERLDSQ